MSVLKTRGRCLRCDKDFADAGMSRHLASCFGPGPALHVAVGVGPGTWWMHLALAPTATLEDLDRFLRATWLECCGHLSAFEVGDTRYEARSQGVADYGWGPKPRSTSTKAATALPAGTKFSYEYDFGSTTELRGRAVGPVAAGKAKVTLLARNETIVWPCDGCGAPALRICPHCGAFACAACPPPCECVHAWADETSRVVNSPRMGVCGYAP